MDWKIFHAEKKKLIELELVRFCEQCTPAGELRDAMLYSLEAGGKRLRPFLAILTAYLLGKSETEILPYACALEFIHTYSLIHDDLPAMDNDDFRRGKPSSHKQFGEDIAILAGDGLLTDAFLIVSRFGTGNIKNGCAYLAGAAGSAGMVQGQVLDCKVPHKERSLDRLDDINLLKTGKLIQASLAGAAAYLDAEEKVVTALEEYARDIGLAFQIADDILDIIADEEELGKPVGSDAKLDKATYPALIGIGNAAKRGFDLVDKAKKRLSSLPDNEYKEMLVSFSDYIIERQK